MTDLLKLKKCPISGLAITTKPEWKYVAEDGSCTIEIAIIGDNIIYEIPTGIINGEANKWYIKTANKIIAEYFGDRNFYIAFDYCFLKNASIEAKKLFINWYNSNSDKIEFVTVFGMNQIIKVAIKTATHITKKYNKLLLTNSYQESINAILQKQNKLTDSIGGAMINGGNNFEIDKQTENTHINELIGYLGKMTWAGNLNQKIPVLPNDDPFAELYTAVAANQDDLREIDKDRDEAYKNSEKLISEKNEALKELSAQKVLVQESEEHYRTLIENSIDAISIIDINGNIVFQSKSAEKITGYTNEERKGKNVFALMLPDDRERMMLSMQENLENYGSVKKIEFRAYHKNGSIRHIEGTAKNMLHSPAIKGIVLNYRDVTERKQAEETLKASKENYRLLTEIMKDVIVRISTTGELLYVSPSTEKFGGYKPEEEIGSDIIKYFAEEKDYQRAVKLITEVVQTHKSGIFEFMYKPKNKAPFPVELTYVPLINNNKVYAIQMVLRDISERKKAEESLKESNKTKDKFFSIIAHDLRSPFNSMLGFSQILHEEFDEYSIEENKEFIGIIYEGLQSTLKLLDDLLSWARSQKGTIAYNPQKINLCLIVDEICGSLNQTIENKSIQIINRITENTYVESDRDMLATIIRNLLSNAIKFTNKHGEITISTIPTQSNNNNQFAKICVSDTGVGIPKKIQSKLFDIAENTSTKGTEGEKGTGLGLILCKEFAEKHGGKIWVESEVGKGSSFFFTIPH